MELIGGTLGNCRIDRLLGDGSMDAVYEGYDFALECEVAIKLIDPHLAQESIIRERFNREARKGLTVFSLRTDNFGGSKYLSEITLRKPWITGHNLLN